MNIGKTGKSKLKIWECALLMALCITLLSGLWAQAAQNRLAGELVRLHVVAVSDSERDQAIKLKVRDAVLDYLAPKLEGLQSTQSALNVISGELDTLQFIAKTVTALEGESCSVSAELARESFPTRYYDTFSLPAGDYVSLRITLGDGGGKNWWCVVFPPLCVNSVETEDAFGELSEENEKLIKTEDGEYVLKFRIIEIFENIRRNLLTKP